MLNKPGSPIELYRSATERAIVVAEAVRPEQLKLATPCSEWTVQDVLDHLCGGAEYLLAAVGQREPVPPSGVSPSEYRMAVARVLGEVATPGAMDRTCLSPMGFEWTIGDAVAGTFMDVLIHTWDLARATGQNETLEPTLVDACVAMFLPHMPEMGRAAGIIGPAVEVRPDAVPQERLIAAMGRQP